MAHRSQKMWPGSERQRSENIASGQMMLEGCALGSRQWAGDGTMKVANEVALAIPGDAISEDEIMHPATDVDGVNLDKTEVSERSPDTERRRAEQDSPAVKAASVEWRKTEDGRHSNHVRLAGL